MANKKNTTPRLTLHQLLGALSFWGASTRLMLIGFIVLIIFALKLLYLTAGADWEIKVIIYVLGSFALLDIGYVMLARAFPSRRRLDILSLLLAETLLLAGYVLPNLVNLPRLSWIANWAVLIVLLVLGIRALLGLLFVGSKR